MMEYTKVWRFYKDRQYTRVQKNRKIGAINKKYKEIVPVIFDWIDGSDDFIRARIEKYFFTFDLNGILIKGKKDL